MAQSDFPDFYFDLGVHRDATSDEIKKAFTEKVKQFHPDHHRNDPAAEERTKRLTLAYDTLKDPEKRAAYDKALQDHYDRLKNPPPPPPKEEPASAKAPEEPASVPPRPSRPRRANWFLLRALVVTVIFSFFYFHYHSATPTAPPSPSLSSPFPQPLSSSRPHPHPASHLSDAEISTIIVRPVMTMTLDPVRIGQEVDRAIDHSGFRPHGSDAFWTMSVSLEGQWGPVTTTGHTFTLAGEATLTGRDGLQLSHHISVTTFWPMGGDSQGDLHREERMFGAKLHRWLLSAHRQIL